MTRCHSKSVPTSWLCVQLNSLQHFLELSKALARLAHCSARVNRDAVPTVYYNVYHPTAAAAALARHFTDWQLLHWHKWQTVHCSEVARNSTHFVCWAKQSESQHTDQLAGAAHLHCLRSPENIFFCPKENIGNIGLRPHLLTILAGKHTVNVEYSPLGVDSLTHSLKPYSRLDKRNWQMTKPLATADWET